MAAPVKKNPRETFPAAHARLFDYLRSAGWSVVTSGPSGSLKVPHATAARVRVWFKAQSVYCSNGGTDLGSARSTMIDVRGLPGPEFVAQVAKYARAVLPGSMVENPAAGMGALPTWMVNPASLGIVEAIRRDGRNRQGMRRAGVLGEADPRKAKTVILRPRWVWLSRGGTWNPAVRAATAGESGVYALRDRASGQVVYVGESHTGRLWKTLLHHFQDPTGRFARLGEWTHARPGRLQVSVWTTRHGAAAVDLEARAQRKFRPSQIVREPAPF